MIVFLTTVVRGAPVEKGGEIVALDWTSKKVLARKPMPPRDLGIADPNPRGNARGGRGIAVVGDEVIAASYHTLHVFARNLEPRREISHGLFAGIHETHYPGNGRLWVTSTSIDCALEIDVKTGNVTDAFWPREIPGFQHAYQLSPQDIDKTVDNRTRHLVFGKKSHVHLNAIATWQGEVYGLFNTFGAVVNLSRGEVVLQDPRLKGGHNLSIDPHGAIIVNDTRRHYVRIYDRQSGEQTQEIDLMAYEWVSRMLRWHLRTIGLRKFLGRYGFPRLARSEPLFVRGLQLVGDTLFVGASPAMVLQIERKSGRLIDAWSFSRDLDSCVHGLWVDSTAAS